jgi:hypothetical protein
MRAVGADRSSRMPRPFGSPLFDTGLRKPPSDGFSGLGDFSPGAGGAAGKRNSGIGFGDVRGDRWGPPGARGAPPIRPNLSGGYDALKEEEFAGREGNGPGIGKRTGLASHERSRAYLHSRSEMIGLLVVSVSL